MDLKAKSKRSLVYSMVFGWFLKATPKASMVNEATLRRIGKLLPQQLYMSASVPPEVLEAMEGVEEGALWSSAKSIH